MAGENGSKTTQDGPADPAPAPALGEEEGHLERGSAPPISAPRVPEPLLAPTLGPSDQSPKNLKSKSAKSAPPKSEKKSAPTKRKTGRKKGCVKTGGRTTAFTGLKPKEIREFLAANSEAVENLCRMARGKPIRRYGPSGKVFWSEVDFPAQKWAIEKVLERLAPVLKSQEMTGDKDNPLAFKDAGEPMSAIELARRTAFLLDAGARETNEARSPDSAPRGVTARSADGSCLSKSAAAPAPTTPAPNEAHEAASSGFNPDIAGAWSDAYGWIEGGHAPHTPEGQDTPTAAPEPDRAPVPGEVADVGGYEIRCKENSRENLPDIFEIWDDHGRQVRYPVNGFDRALKKIQELVGDVDMTVKITKPRPAFSQSRPDERAARTVSAPVVVGSYAHRKR